MGAESRSTDSKSSLSANLSNDFLHCKSTIKKGDKSSYRLPCRCSPPYLWRLPFLYNPIARLSVYFPRGAMQVGASCSYGVRMTRIWRYAGLGAVGLLAASMHASPAYAERLFLDGQGNSPERVAIIVQDFAFDSTPVPELWGPTSLQTISASSRCLSAAQCWEDGTMVEVHVHEAW